MNVTQVIQSANQIRSKGQETIIDEQSFSKEFNKYSLSSATVNKDLTEENTEPKVLKENPSDTDEKDMETEEIPFSQINPFLKLDTVLTTLAKEAQSFILHTEPTNNEANSFVDSQIPLTDSGQILQELGDTEWTTSINDTGQLLDKETLTLLAGEINQAIESFSTSGSNAVTTESIALMIQESIQMTEDNELEIVSLQKIVSTIVEDVLRMDKKIPLNNVNQVSNDLINDSPEKPSVTDRPITSTEKEVPNSAQTAARDVRVPKVTDKQVEVTGLKITDTESKTSVTPDTQVTRSGSRIDTDYDFVSMLRQMSNGSIKSTNQVNTGNPASFNETVSKDQSITVIQEMMTSFVENKEGLSSYKSTLTLTPEMLGEVKIELTLTEEGLSGKLTFQSDETRKWMEGEWLDLKVPLESKGLTIKGFDFATSQPDSLQSGFSFSEQSGQDSQKKFPLDQNEQVSIENPDQVSEEETNSTSSLNVYV